MGFGAFIVLIFAAVVIGFAVQMIGTPRFRYDWAIAGAGAAIGAFIAGQYLGVFTTWGPTFDGMYLLPAALGAIVVAGVAALVLRLTEPVGAAA